MTTVTVNDPKYLDGETHEVAAIAGKQVQQTLALAETAVEGFRWAARGAWLSAEEVRTGAMPEPGAYEASPQGQKMLSLLKDVLDAQKLVKTLTIAASYDPHCVS